VMWEIPSLIMSAGSGPEPGMQKASSFSLLFLMLLLAACGSPSENVSPVVDEPLLLPLPTPTSTMISPVNVEPTTCLDRAVFGNPADSPYILPYPVGRQYKVSLKYCQRNSSHSDQLSYDFAMALGDEVTAARSGRVVKLDEHFTDDGTDSGAMDYNFIMILHEDGTVAFYAHLMQDSILVEIGEWVEAGQPIARVGFSGMPRGVPPCLHFGVYAFWPPEEGQDVAVNFKNAGGELDACNGLTIHRSYEALPWEP
jgi:murein DD-endopeptidase MepM/ murein hydrolase activator NlpD